MNKILKFLILFIVAASLTVGTVAASNLVDHNFDGKFTALYPEGDNFASYSGDGITVWGDSSTTLWYIYAENDGIDSSTIDKIWDGFCDKFSMKITKTDGDMTIFKVNNETLGTDAIGIYEDGKAFMVTGENLDELKDIAKSVKFD